MHHKRRRPLVSRASCWCKFEKKVGIRALRGGKEYKGAHAARERILAARAGDME